MATNFQSSFIPKETITGKSGGVGNKSILSFLGLLFLIISIVASVGLFIYKGMLGGELEELKSSLILAESAIDKDAVEKITIFNKKLNLIKEILDKHQASSNFLGLLSSSTVSGVQFSELKYNYLSTGGLDVKLRGKSSAYDTLALQENEFSKLKEIKKAKFSNLSLVEKGLVGFELDVSVDPVISIYNPEISSVPETSETVTELDSDLDLENLDDLDLTDLENI